MDLKKKLVWHFSEPLPDFSDAWVYHFSANGDELEVIIRALRATLPPEPVTIEGKSE